MSTLTQAPETTGKGMFESSASYPWRDRDDVADPKNGSSYVHQENRWSATEANEWLSFQRWVGEYMLRQGLQAVQARNESGGTLTAGTLVYISGWDAAESRWLISKADAATPNFAAFVLADDISNNANGTAYKCIRIETLDTSSFSAANDPVYLSDTAGAFHTAAGTAEQIVGRVEVVNASTGVIVFDVRVAQATISTSPTFTGITVSGLSASRLVATDGSKALASADLVSWVAGTSNQVNVADDGDGSITLSTPQDIDSTASPTFTDVKVNGATVGTSGVGVVSLANGTAPSTNPADCVQLYSMDRVAGKAGLVVDTEDGTSHIISDFVGFGTLAPTQKLHVVGQGFFATSDAQPDPGDASGPGVRVGYYTSGDYGYLYAVDTGVSYKTLALQPNGGSCHLFNNIPEGQTPEWKISGYRSGVGGIQTMAIGVGVDAADQASFDGVSTYLFDGKVTATQYEQSGQNVLHFSVCNGRISLTTATAITTSDVTAATTIYFTPHRGNSIGLYTGSIWRMYQFTEKSISVPATTDTNYDLFIYDNAGTLTLETTAWTNDTTRATALTTQDGLYVKSGDATRRYLGTFRTTGTSGQTEDSENRRFVWNYYNRVERVLFAKEPATSWTYSTASWRAMNSNTTYGQGRVGVVIGVEEDLVCAHAHNIHVGTSAAGVRVYVGIGVDSTSTNSGDIGGHCRLGNIDDYGEPNSWYRGYTGIGFHYIQTLEYGGGSGVQTWLGDEASPTLKQSGLQVEVCA